MRTNIQTVYDLDICDSHHHLWDLQANGYPWLTEEIKGPRVCGDYRAIQNKNFLLADFFTNRGYLKVTRFVHEEAVIDRSDPVRETAWLQSIADGGGSEGMPHAILAYADFSKDNIEAVLDAHIAYLNLRGIRQMVHEAVLDPAKPDLLADAKWREKVGLCKKHNLSFELQVYWQQMENAVDLVKSHPDVTFVLTHTGLPARQDDDEYMLAWRSAIKRLAELPNLNCKLSGFGMFDRSWTSASIQAVIIPVIDSFGVERCFFGSNFPVDSLAGKSYAACWEDFFEAVTNFSDDEKRKLFNENARRVYRI